MCRVPRRRRTDALVERAGGLGGLSSLRPRSEGKAGALVRCWDWGRGSHTLFFWPQLGWGCPWRGSL